MQKVIEKISSLESEKLVEKYSGPPLSIGTKLNGCWTSVHGPISSDNSVDPLNVLPNTSCVCQPIVSKSDKGVLTSKPTSWTIVGGSNYKNFEFPGSGPTIYGCG